MIEAMHFFQIPAFFFISKINHVVSRLVAQFSLDVKYCKKKKNIQ